MAVDKLVDSTELDAALGSVADAIRAKSGGSSQLAFPSEFVSEIQAIPSGGGGTNYIDGTFTLVSDSSFPEITHNFGTTKIAGFVIPHFSIAAHAGYRDYMSFFVNWAAYIGDDETWTKDFTSYNSSKFPNPSIASNASIKSQKQDAGFGSPWTTQSGQWQGTYYTGLVVTDTTIRVGTGATWCSGTYYYRFFKLE